MRKDFSRLPGEHIITWLLRCWDNGASSLELEGREAKQLGSLSREGGIDKAIGKKAQALSLWRRLLSSVRERYPFSEDVLCRPGKRTTMERGIQYLRELAVQEMFFYDPDNVQLPTDPDEVQCTRLMAEVSTERTIIICQLTGSNRLEKRRVWKSNGEWRLTVDYRGLNEVTPPMSAAVPDMLELQYELESKAAKWYATTDIANAFFSIPLAAECRPQFAFTWRGVQYTWNRLPQGWKHSPTICHGLIQTALEQGEALEHLQYIDDITVWGNTAEEGKNIVQILLKAGFIIKQNIAARLEKLVVKVCHVDAHIPKSQATEEHQNNQQVDQAAKIEVAQVDLDWQRKGELFIARWAHDTSGHQGRDGTYRWARDRGVDLTMDAISQVIHECETCAAIKQAKWVKPLWYGGQWLKYKYGEAWQIDYITLPQTRQGKRYVLTMVEITTRWLETYPMPHATAQNTVLGLEKQVLWQHGTPERVESDNKFHFRNNLIDTWAKEHGH
ncbi:hypothetical protein GRJ2_003332900 [Grus japonensis]|uniref:ribonuclease H n=1 Tax=Grus japonensis TaxID=30415 RepID=A0ABC9YID0_GRUJA